MRCEDLQFDLALSTDDAIPEKNFEILREHLAACPLCRQKRDDMREVRTALRSLARPRIPDPVILSVRRSLKARVEPTTRPFGIFNATFRVPSFRLWIASYSIGACASVVFGLAFFWLIFLANTNAGRRSANAFAGSRAPVSVADPVPGLDSARIVLSPKDFADTRSDIASVSPSVNPQGSLIELTRSLVNNDIRNDEMVVVADVYGNGSAQIAEVVEPSRNQNAVPELARALDYEAVNAPFVPATFDQRSDTIRVVLKIQSVDVSTKEPSRKRRSL